jgi:hypothetical protein
MIGIPWKAKGRDHDGIDCVGLALLAQKELFGREYEFPFDYDPETGDESVLLHWLEGIADEADTPRDGDLIVYRMPGIDGKASHHIGTVVDGALLHIYPGKASRKVRLLTKRITAIYRAREVETCREQQ